MRRRLVQTCIAAAVLAFSGVAFACGTPVSYFKGSYYHHGVSVSVDAAGNGRISYRTYKWCGPGVPQPCDSIVNNYIYDGGKAAFKLTSPLSSHTGVGVITSGNQLRPGQRVTLSPLRVKIGLPSVLNSTVVLPVAGSLVLCGTEYVAACGP